MYILLQKNDIIYCILFTSLNTKTKRKQRKLMTYPNCLKCGKQSLDEIDHITFFLASRCRICFSAYLEYLRLSPTSTPTDVCVSTYLNKQYCDLLLPYLDQQRKKARELRRREHLQQQQQQQLQPVVPGGPVTARRRLEF